MDLNKHFRQNSPPEMIITLEMTIFCPLVTRCMMSFKYPITTFSDSIHSRFFLEEDAVDLDGKLNRPKQKAVNKIGHGTSLVL